MHLKVKEEVNPAESNLGVPLCENYNKWKGFSFNGYWSITLE
jgi:hypothetical protein